MLGPYYCEGSSIRRRADLHEILAGLNRKRGPIPYLIATALVLVSFLARLSISPWVGSRSPFLPFIAAVVLAAGLYGVGPGLVAITLSSIFATWAFIGPGGLTPDQIVNIVVFIVTGGAMILFANHLRQTTSRAERLELDLQQAQATAAMGTMAGTLAHELNQPLAAAANYVAACQQLASLSGEEAPSMAEGLRHAETQIQRAGEIIRQARALVRNSPVEREIASLKRMFQRVIDLVKATEAGETVEFKIEVGPGADSVGVNTIQFEQVLLNLVRNACQAMQNSSPAKMRLKAASTDRGTLVEVSDTGVGIRRDRLSTLFSATHSSPTGLGIGLSICRTIVEAHGGSIWAQNDPEGGASFFVLLPTGDEAA
ncbi:MAG TPA: ATP-binding protein [Sphingomicrobium sp.]